MRRPPSTDFCGTVWRWTSYDVAWCAGPNFSPGRWHDEHSPPTQYLSLSAAGAWAEMVRHFGLTDPADAADARFRLWRGWMELADVADLTAAGACERHGLPAGALGSDDHQVCQLESHRLRGLGFEAVLSPSAALSGETNLVVWGARRPIAWRRVSTTEVEPVKPAFRSDIPTELVAIGGPDPGLVPYVRHRGS
ncbi:RES family NAD+ phosphorylase [Patulibacter defluvii]|uniref:RES family NAD+ phosphorylase n=1 Tax=Patulibacter defluvii TaxID=3095358 RepID=UPI002A74D5D1|nr:RES family NAD+ phosphorylase [Patulibacter sp. DM4]